MKRRELSFLSAEEALNNAQQLLDNEYHRVGNWSLGQICNHVGHTAEFLGRLPVPRVALRFALYLFLRFAFIGKIGRIFRLWLPTILPQQKPVEDAVGFERMKSAFENLKDDDTSFGAFNVWHAQHHLSFLVPRIATAAGTDH
jgi:hypothetical protein